MDIVGKGRQEKVTKQLATRTSARDLDIKRQLIPAYLWRGDADVQPLRVSLHHRAVLAMKAEQLRER